MQQLEAQLEVERALHRHEIAEIRAKQHADADGRREAARLRKRTQRARERGEVSAPAAPRRRWAWTDRNEDALRSMGIPYEVLIIQCGMSRKDACAEVAATVGKTYDAVRNVLVRLDHKGGICEPPPPASHR